ncbi:hypothetical protein [Dongia rigui]|uniref:Uncharacterized protein n=1 Tax=Dongia rigui TaxID=940149 RepID=A0ABU5DUQ4_9PROT|nr:hypothetical protein [Dongia rigui]MDY0871043.1 hypothetical protein [Dongia rigui]
MPAAALAALGLAMVAGVQMMPRAVANAPVAVFVWQGDALASVIGAGGRMLGPGGLPGSIIAIGDTPDFANRLYASGASLVLRADASLGCSAERIGS